MVAPTIDERPPLDIVWLGPPTEGAERIAADSRWRASHRVPEAGEPLPALALGSDVPSLARFASRVPDVPIAWCADEPEVPEALPFVQFHLPAHAGPAEVALCLELAAAGEGSRLVDSSALDLRTLPSMPSDLTNLLATLDRPGATTGDVVRAMRRDPALVAKTLQLANSSYFRLPRRVSSIERAITLLGVNAIRVAAMAGRCFDALRGVPPNEVSIVRDRGLLAVQLCRVLAGREHPTLSTAALLMDIGQLVLLRADRAYPRLRFECVLSKRPLPEAEVEAYGASHAHFGASLLSVWGLPREVCSAIAFSHTPFPLPHERDDLRCALFVASALIDESETGRPGSHLDPRWVSAMGLDDRVDEARALATSLATQSPAA
jgi:HD-like signal output (HDOD) protein